MKKVSKITDNHAFFVDFALFWVILGWIALVCALADFFYAWIFVAYFVLAVAYFVWTLATKRKVLSFTTDFVIASAIILVSVSVSYFFATPTVFSGRDQGSISNAAINLSQNHQLEFSNTASEELFAVYGKGKALNFPGFYYTKNGGLIPQFPLGYISWIGAFYSVFGLPGLVIANSVSLFLFLMSFYVIGKKLFNIRYAALLIAFALTSFSFVWFYKYTLSENLALALLWIVVLSVLYVKKNLTNKSLMLYLFSATLLLFTRIEGYAFFLTSILVMLWDKNIRDLLLKNKIRILLFGLFFFSIFLANLFKNLPFFVEIGKAILASIPGKSAAGNEPFSVANAGIRIFQIHTLYGLILFFLFGTIGIIRSFAGVTKTILIPLIIVSPALIYLIDSNISSDHPWMLRRFSFAILPLFILYATYLLKFMFERNAENSRYPMFSKQVATVITFMMLVANLGASGRYAFYSEDRGLLEQTQEFSQKFSARDLVMIDRLASENGWSMIAGPMQALFKKQAVYLVNIDDLEKIKLEKFENVYIVTPEKNLPFYAGSKFGNRLEITERYSFKTDRLREEETVSQFPIIKYPLMKSVWTEGYILKLEK